MGSVRYGYLKVLAPLAGTWIEFHEGAVFKGERKV